MCTTIVPIMLAVVSFSSILSTKQGLYFAKKQYEPKPLPTFAATKDKPPAPIFEEDPNYVRRYWKAWELAFKNFHEPAPGSGYVSSFINAAFNQNIFLWDTCFMTMGGYWKGTVWVPTDKMVMAGLEAYGYADLAREIALNHLRNVVTIFKETGTIWENYAPQTITPGKPAKPDFVGWSGIGPIAFFLEYVIGVRANAPANKVVWDIHSSKRVGVERLWFGGKTVSLVCEPAEASDARTVTVKSRGAFDLTILWRGKTTTMSIPADKEVQLHL